jgi:outer membrane protein assembly factor BamD
MIKKSLVILIAFVGFTVVSCSKYNRLLKSDDYAKKLEMAIYYYEKTDYYRALQLFDDVIAVYRGKEQAEKIHYYYAYCYYGQEDYLIASYHFKNFSKIFPNSKYAEECLYMSAYCKYLDSPVYSLDQSSTYEAIKELQAFINFYPKSERVAEANKLIDDLRAKLAKKFFETAKLYYKIESYNAAQIAFNNVLKDFPETSFKEEILYYIVKSNYYLAKNSVESKKNERLNNVVTSYNNFVNVFPQSKYLNELQGMYKNVLSEISSN